MRCPLGKVRRNDLFAQGGARAMNSLLMGAVVKELCPVHDYWQLVTDKPRAMINNPFEIMRRGEVLLCSQYNAVREQTILAEEYVEGELYQITLTDDISIKISLRAEDYTCPEGVAITDSSAGMFVVF